MSVEIYLFKSYSHLRRKKRAVLPPVNRSETAFNRWKERFVLSKFEPQSDRSFLNSTCVLPESAFLDHKGIINRPGYGSHIYSKNTRISLDNSSRLRIFFPTGTLEVGPEKYPWLKKCLQMAVKGSLLYLMNEKSLHILSIGPRRLKEVGVLDKASTNSFKNFWRFLLSQSLLYLLTATDLHIFHRDVRKKVGRRTEIFSSYDNVPLCAARLATVDKFEFVIVLTARGNLSAYALVGKKILSVLVDDSLIGSGGLYRNVTTIERFVDLHYEDSSRKVTAFGENESVCAFAYLIRN